MGKHRSFVTCLLTPKTQNLQFVHVSGEQNRNTFGTMGPKGPIGPYRALMALKKKLKSPVEMSQVTVLVGYMDQALAHFAKLFEDYVMELVKGLLVDKVCFLIKRIPSPTEQLCVFVYFCCFMADNHFGG